MNPLDTGAQRRIRKKLIKRFNLSEVDAQRVVSNLVRLVDSGVSLGDAIEFAVDVHIAALRDRGELSVKEEKGEPDQDPDRLRFWSQLSLSVAAALLKK